jgi:hypothetical protein
LRENLEIPFTLDGGERCHACTPYGVDRGDAGAHQRRRPLCGTTSRRRSAGSDLQRPVEGAQGQPVQRQLDRRAWSGSGKAVSERQSSAEVRPSDRQATARALPSFRSPPRSRQRVKRNREHPRVWSRWGDLTTVLIPPSRSLHKPESAQPPPRRARRGFLWGQPVNKPVGPV